MSRIYLKDKVIDNFEIISNVIKYFSTTNEYFEDIDDIKDTEIYLKDISEHTFDIIMSFINIYDTKKYISDIYREPHDLYIKFLKDHNLYNFKDIDEELYKRLIQICDKNGINILMEFLTDHYTRHIINTYKEDQQEF